MPTHAFTLRRYDVLDPVAEPDAAAPPPEPAFLTPADLRAIAARREAKRRARRDWGRWHLDLKARELLFFEYPGCCTYPVDLDTITDAAEALDMIAQVAGKGWATAEDIGNLVFALDDIFRLQGSLCGMGTNRTVNARAVIKARMS